MQTTSRGEYRTYKRPDTVEPPKVIPEWLKEAMLADLKRHERAAQQRSTS